VFFTHKSNFEQASSRGLGYCSLPFLLITAFIVKW